METNNLIVDFPPERRAGERRRRPAVQFSSEVDVHFCQPLHHDAKDELFYSSRDYSQFKRTIKRDVQDVRRRSLVAGENAGAFAECDLTGIENLLTPEPMKRRVGCIGAVLDEQERQDEAGESDPELLASVSRHRSRWAMERSRKIGMLHALAFR